MIVAQGSGLERLPLWGARLGTPFMKSIRLKILAMLAIVAAGAILSAIISIYGLHKADDLNNRCLLYTSRCV